MVKVNTKEGFLDILNILKKIWLVSIVFNLSISPKITSTNDIASAPSTYALY